jgi:hypothetical protein
MHRIIGILVLFFVVLSAAAHSQQSPPRSAFNPEHTEWISNALRSMQNVKVGMTRADLMRIFGTEGGISTTSQRTYVYRQCPYIKVDVKFAASSREGEMPTDKIIEISRPYLEWSIMD